jgi:glutamine amidotransferase
VTQPSIVIIDYGVGNIFSVSNAIRALGYRKLKISSVESDILSADALILPGVGAFEVCAKNLRERQLEKVLDEAVFTRGKPILGICVGMQLMASSSEENGLHVGLNWIPGKVVKLSLPLNYSIPHVGWNDLSLQYRTNLFSRMKDSPNFYFDHSYHYQCDSAYVTAECNYGIAITAAIQKDNIYGVQFHPEKSQNNGLRLFRNFLSIF